MGKAAVVSLHKNIVVEDASGTPIYFLRNEVLVPTSKKFTVTHLSNSDLVLVELNDPPKMDTLSGPSTRSIF